MAELAAIKADRHTVAVAIFSGMQLIHVHSRALSSDVSRSERSALAFIDRILATHPAKSVVFEKAPPKTQRAKLIAQLAGYLRSTGISVNFVDGQGVIESFSFPPVRKRHEARKIIKEIWPVLAIRRGSPLQLDAAGLGLFAQAEHLLSQNSS